MHFLRYRGMLETRMDSFGLISLACIWYPRVTLILDKRALVSISVVGDLLQELLSKSGCTISTWRIASFYRNFKAHLFARLSTGQVMLLSLIYSCWKKLDSR